MPLEIRSYRDGDERGIVRLFGGVFGREMTIGEWNWKYRGHGASYVPSAVIEDQEHGIVGHYGGILLRMVRNGSEEMAVASCDVMIHPRFRGFTRLKKLQTFFFDQLVGSSVRMIYGFATEQTLMIPADKLRLLERVEVVEQAVKDAAPARGLSRHLYSFHPLDFDDPAIDGLWDDVRAQFRMAVVRDRQYLAWRYRDNPLFAYELWGLRRIFSKKLLALAVFRKTPGEGLLIMDIVFGRGLLPPLLANIGHLASSFGTKRLSLWAPGQIRETLRAEGFALQSTGTPLGIPVRTDIVGKEEILENFFYSMGDTDYL